MFHSHSYPQDIVQLRGTFEAFMEAFLKREAVSKRLYEAMRYGVLKGGKRIRPLLLMKTGQLLEVSLEKLLAPACAVEFVHCYSLIHDDLPAMDDDDLRRGQPTLHKAYDEATALLAGNGLLSYAQDVLLEAEDFLSNAQQVKLLKALSLATGAQGMIGGQMLDLEAEGRFHHNVALTDQKRTPFDCRDIEKIHYYKTGALIRACLEMACVIGEVSDPVMRALLSYGHFLGLAYQLSDDVLDLISTTEEAGKITKKDQCSGKQTYCDLLGLEGAQKLLGETIDKGLRALDCFGDQAHWHHQLLKSMAGRKS